MQKILFIVLFLPVFSLAQDKKYEVLTDTSMVVGIIKEDEFVGRSIGSYCISGVDKYLKKGTIVLISGVEVCTNSYSNKEYFEILYKNQTYYAERNKIITNETNFEQIASMYTSLADSFRIHAQDLAKILYRGDLRKALNFLAGCKTKGLAILDWSFYDESKYTEGTSVKIKVYNPTPKTIKYLWFTFIGYNAVDDKIVDRKRGANITMKGIGPINPDASGTYEYSYVWFTDLVESCKILSIKIQYMDGSYKIVSNPKGITLPQELYEILLDDE